MYKSQYKYPFDPSSKKFYCPNCLHKTFVLFIQPETGMYLDNKFGICDRKLKCGYYRAPEDNYTINKSIYYSHLKIKKSERSLIPLKFVDQYFDPKREKENHFIQFLHTKFNNQQVDEIIKKYFLSTCKYWGKGATIFWQIAENDDVRSGQVLLYDSITGKRVKKPFNHITWVHTILKKNGHIKEFNLEQTLFGMHLISREPENKIIAIVEAPKTACIMSTIFPDYLWMATCGLSNINLKRLNPIKPRKIVLYPDLGAYKIWKTKANIMKKAGYKIEVSTLLETKYQRFPAGSDIADLFIDKL